jgi:catechol 2,3-dioxygenase-like lactoylglutathione lyase family enzyme
VVCGVLIDVLVAEDRARADYEGGAQLGDSFATLLDPEPGPMGGSSPAQAPGVEEESGGADRPDRSRVGGHRVVVDEHGEGNALILHERACIADVSGTDGDHLAPEGSDLGVDAAQLRGVLSAEQSAEVAQEDKDDRTVCPELAEAIRLAVTPSQRHAFERKQIHERHDATSAWAPRPEVPYPDVDVRKRGSVTVTSLANIAVKVSDLDAACRFYEGAGASVQDRMWWNGGERADIWLGPVLISLFTRAIYEDTISVPEGFLHPAMFTDDLDRELESHTVLWGPRVVEGAFGRRRIAFVEAPGGMRLEFMEQLAAPDGAGA